ncbi:MAG: hypothetical protein H6750_11425 [Nitrospiraceae bacterium]|nr:hypothetical protein [Nitrospiraceae bacterium]
MSPQAHIEEPAHDVRITNNRNAPTCFMVENPNKCIGYHFRFIEQERTIRWGRPLCLLEIGNLSNESLRVENGHG